MGKIMYLAKRWTISGIGRCVGATSNGVAWLWKTRLARGDSCLFTAIYDRKHLVSGDLGGSLSFNLKPEASNLKGELCNFVILFRILESDIKTFSSSADLEKRHWCFQPCLKHSDFYSFLRCSHVSSSLRIQQTRAVIGAFYLKLYYLLPSRFYWRLRWFNLSGFCEESSAGTGENGTANAHTTKNNII